MEKIITARFVNGKNGHKFATHNRTYKLVEGKMFCEDMFSKTGFSAILYNDLKADVKTAENRDEIMREFFATENAMSL